MTRYWKYVGWAGMTGLVLSISISHGIDITKEGIARIILEGLKPLVPMIGYLLIDLFLFTSAIVSSFIEYKKLVDEGIEVVIMCACFFLFIFLVYIGTNFNIDFIQQIGVIPLFVGIGILAYLSWAKANR